MFKKTETNVKEDGGDLPQGMPKILLQEDNRRD